MQDQKRSLEELFQKYREGQVTGQEKEVVARWLVQLDLRPETAADDDLRLQQQLRSQADLKNHFFPQHELPVAKVYRLPVWLKSIAAGILLFISAGAILYFVTKAHKTAVIAIAYGEEVTHKGEMKVVTLGDGTRITLNNESHIRYPLAFNEKKREVYLSGEAFFEVMHNPAKPFLVHADKINVQVLGTSFDVKAYQKDKSIAIAVSSGKVGVNPSTAGKSGPYFLLPGDQLEYNRNTAMFTRGKTDASAIADWQTGVLTFDNETLIDITRQLERVYSATFFFRNEDLRKKVMSLKLKNQSLPVVMKALSISGSFHYRISEEKITIW